MNVNECFICPVCRNDNVVITSATAFMSDIRADTMRCTVCKAEWRLYFKVGEARVEVFNHAPQEASSYESDSIEEPTTEC